MPRKIRCKEQQKKWNREFYLRNKHARIELNNKKRDEIKEFINAFKASHPCSCGESHIACLQFHHIDSESKEHAISSMIQNMFSLTKIKFEIEKCVVLCANCHFKFHYNERTATYPSVR